MDRPLWQIFLTLFVLSFVVHRGAAAFMLYAGDLGPELFLAYAFQAAAGLATALGLWLGRRWVLGALVILGVSVAATAILEGFFLGVRPGALALGEVLVAAVSTSALLLVLRHEFSTGETSGRFAKSRG